MTPARWAEVDKLLDEALAREPQERAAFLESACQDDEELRREVESLLKAHQKAEEKFLKTPALEIAAQGFGGGSGERSLIGQTVSHYSVISILGVGGMGEVYLARDTKLERKAALKFLPPQYTRDAVRIRRFEREARAASALNHPNIITIYEIGDFENKHFIAAEYVDGQTLREMLSRGRLAVKDAIEIAIQICAALSAAHEAGIIHRDIKPENVMVRRDGFVKVLDFGLVKLTEQANSTGRTNASDGDLAKTNPGAVLGTVKYMSPEQALGQEVDRRSDIFSLGVVLYELLAGTPPFKGDRVAATLDAIVHHQPISLSSICPELPAELCRIVSRALEKELELRYQSAGDFRSELKLLQRDLDSSSSHTLSGVRRSIRPRPASPWINTRLLLAVGAVLLLAVIALLWRLFFQVAPEPSPWLAAYSSQITNSAYEILDPSLSPDGKTIYFSKLVKNKQDIYWQRLAGSNEQKLLADSDGVSDFQPACSPDGNLIAFASSRQNGGIFVCGSTGESLRKVSSFGYNPAWSPNGKQIIFNTESASDPRRRGAESKLYIVSSEGGAPSMLSTGDDAAQPRWSPGGKRIVYYSKPKAGGRGLWTIRPDGGGRQRLTDGEALDWNPVWSPDGRYVYFISDRNSPSGLWRVAVDETTGQPLGKPESIAGLSIEGSQIDLSHDGRRIVYIRRVGRANLRAVNFDPIRKVTVGEHGWVTEGSRPSGSPDFSRENDRVVYHTLGADQEDLFVVGANGGTPANLTNDKANERNPRWSPTENRIAFHYNLTGKSQIWLVNPDGSGKTQLTFADQNHYFPFWSPDGKRLGYRLGNGGSYLIEMDKPVNQQTPWSFPPPGESRVFRGWLWSSDGKRIAGKVAVLRQDTDTEEPPVYAYSLENQTYEVVAPEGNRPIWLNDNRHLLVALRGELYLVDTQSKAKELQKIVSVPNYQISSMALSSDNRRIIYTATDSQSNIRMLSLDK